MRKQSCSQKYLGRYAEEESELAPRICKHFDRSFSHTIVIPARAEKENLLRTLQSIPSERSTLIIVVVNDHSADPLIGSGNNRSTIQIIAQCGPLRARHSKYALYTMKQHVVCAIDRLWPVKYGVGIARKAGCDLALAFGNLNAVQSRWIHCTDADVLLPEDYFELPTLPGSSGIVYPFRHHAEEAQDRETLQLYELRIRHYVLGLRYATSPYAFHTIGSTIAVDREAYAQVRGFPKRAAGEDFHLLNKVVKVGPLHHANTNPISIAGRLSERVPFGTGPTLQKGRQGTRPTAYHPGVFEQLKLLLEIQQRDCSPHSQWQEIKSHVAHPHLLEQLGFPEMLRESYQACSTHEARIRRRHTWMDGLRTLRWIHLLQKTAFPQLAVEEALGRSPFVGRTQQSLDEWLEHLVELGG